MTVLTPAAAAPARRLTEALERARVLDGPAKAIAARARLLTGQGRIEVRRHERQ